MSERQPTSNSSPTASTSTASSPTSSRRRSRRASTRTSCGSSPPRRTSRSGCSSGGSRRSSASWTCSRTTGADLGERRLPADRLPGHRTTTRRRSRRRSSRASTRSTRSCSRPTRSSASRCSEQKRLAGVAVDAVFDSVSVATTFKEELEKLGIIFCSFSRGGRRTTPSSCGSTSARSCPTPTTSSRRLNSAVFSDGSFAYIPKGVRCPMELSTYFRINAAETGPVRAHADRRRRGRVRVATSRAARRRCATRTSSTPRSSSWSRSTTPRSSTRPCRTGTRATRKARAASTTS